MKPEYRKDVSEQPRPWKSSKAVGAIAPGTPQLECLEGLASLALGVQVQEEDREHCPKATSGG